MNNIIIREEKVEDYAATELVTMRSFWNIHGPGCNEHLFAHKLRMSEDYLPEISRVAELDGKIVGVIMFSKAKVIDGDTVHEILSFGPLAVDPMVQSMGVGRRLMEASFELAREQGYPGICIFGEPEYYPRYGFQDCEKFGITDLEGNNYDTLMGYELYEGAFDNVKGKFKETEVAEQCEDEQELEEFSKQFPIYKKLKLKCQWLHEEKLGRISMVSKDAFTIKFWEMEVPAKLCESFYNSNQDFPVVGDYVTFDFNRDGTSTIYQVCERSSVLTCANQSGHAIDDVATMKEQVMIANVDYVFIVTSLNANYNLNQIARYVSSVYQGDSVPVVILTKADLCNNTQEIIEDVKGLSENVIVHAVSSCTGEGIEELKKYIEPDKTIALLGSSGVEKSTLVNCLAGKEVMQTGELREEDAKERHTTTSRQMIYLENGATIIDTPAM